MGDFAVKGISVPMSIVCFQAVFICCRVSVSQVSDFVLLSATPTLLLTCGSYGAGARMLSTVIQRSYSYPGACSPKA